MMDKRFSRREWLVGAMGLAGTGLFYGLGPFSVKSTADSVPLVRASVVALGTRVSFVVRHSDTRFVQSVIERAIAKIFDVHAIMTLHDESPLTVLNRRGLESPVVVPEALLNVLRASQRITQATGGAFDASVRGSMVGMNHVEVDEKNRNVRFHHPGTSLDFNGIAKGYAVDCAVAELHRSGIFDFIVNAGGDLYASGSASPLESGWEIHIEDAGHSWILSDRAVATSGNRHRPSLKDGGLDIHLLDPATGHEIEQYVSTTIIAKTTMEADAWSTAMFVGDPVSMADRVHQRADLQAGLIGPDDMFSQIG
jgi:thiamine biosynthesis lipoprotein